MLAIFRNLPRIAGLTYLCASSFVSHRMPAGATQEVCRVLSPRQQAEIFWQAQSAWYVTLICSQFWHIWVCKTRVVSFGK